MAFAVGIETLLRQHGCVAYRMTRFATPFLASLARPSWIQSKRILRNSLQPLLGDGVARLHFLKLHQSTKSLLMRESRAAHALSRTANRTFKGRRLRSSSIILYE